MTDHRARISEMIDKARQPADDGRETVEWIIERRKRRPKSPRPWRLEKLVNDWMVPAWKAIGVHESLLALQAGKFFTHTQLENCQREAFDEACNRARAVELQRQAWKRDGYPESGEEVIIVLTKVLAPCYRAKGAVDALEALLSQ